MANDNFFSSPMTRRRMLSRAAMLAAGAAGGSALLSACGGGSGTNSGPASSTLSGPPAPESVKGSAVYLNYPGWIGSNTIADFHKQYPGAEIKESASGFETSTSVAQAIGQNPKAYDLLLLNNDIAQRLAAANLILPIDEKTVPSLALVEDRFRKAIPNTMPIDTDTFAIGYRKDIIKEPPRTWADVWRLATQYNQKVIFTGMDRPALGIALIYKGFKADSTDANELTQAKDALLEIKPHVLAFKVSDLAQPLADGTAVLSVGLSYEFVSLMADNPNIDVAFPEDGTVFDVEAIAAVSATQSPEIALTFLDFVMRPPNYANFINTTRAARVSTAADSMIDKVLLSPKMDVPANATMQGFPGVEGAKAVTLAWQQFQSG